MTSIPPGFFDCESGGPGERLATGREREGLGTVPGGFGKARSIAVLPFVDMSPGSDQDYFAEGIAEELLNSLERFAATGAGSVK